MIHHPEWLDALTQAAGAGFDELVGGRKGAGSKAAGRNCWRIIPRCTPLIW